ncbi:MAG: hypothetical protein ACRC2I_02835 [Plesiomonas shigelloides]
MPQCNPYTGLDLTAAHSPSTLSADEITGMAKKISADITDLYQLMGDDLSEQLGISASYLAHIFGQITSHSGI